MVTETKLNEQVVVREDKIVQLMKLALEGREKGLGIFRNGIEPPEARYVEIIKGYGKVIASEVFPLHTIFFTTMTLFADNSSRQLTMMTNKLDFALNSWLFKPERVVKKDPSDVYKTAYRLINPGYNSRALEQWYYNAEVLMKYYNGDLRNFLAANSFEAPKILEELIGPKRKEPKNGLAWAGFRRFGPKLARLFLQWVNQYHLLQINGQTVELKRIDSIGIPVDFQVVRLTVGAGGIELPRGPVHKHWVLDKTLIPLYTGICLENGLNPQKISEAFYLIGNKCCNNYRHDLCPLASLCTRLISREPWDEFGLVDPRDIGRYKSRQQVMVERRGQLVFPGI